MIPSAAYILLGIGTALLTFGREMNRRDHVITFAVWLLIWPVIWLQIAAIYTHGKHNERCVWCGEFVGPCLTFKGVIFNEADDRIKTLWRSHYLNECKEHPLAQKIQALEGELERWHDRNRPAVWEQQDFDDCDTWRCSGCENLTVWEISPEECEVKFCQNCGRPVTFERYPSPTATDE